MFLSEIMRPLKSDAAADGVRLPMDTDVYDVAADWLSESCAAVYLTDKAGRVQGYVGREVLVYLLENNPSEMLGRIVDDIDEGVIAVDQTGRVFYANQTYTRLLGVPLGKIIGRQLRQIESEAALLQVLETRNPLTKPKTHIKSINLCASVRMFPLYVNGEFRGAYSLFRDVTELNHLNREIDRITQVAREYQSQIDDRNERAELHIIGDAPAFRNTLDKAALVAKTDVTVLIRGENGVGKDLLARLVHNASPRKDAPFIAVNCAAIPETLIESELFGYAPGAFTGADKRGKPGKFELADKGTLFLDEVGDMPLPMQAKLLRALQEGEIERIGSGAPRKVNVRVIAATNQPLEELVKGKNFRQDLYYRLNVMPVEIPPLRQRTRDILLLVNHFLARFNRQYGKNIAISGEAYQCMEQYNWPGNVRELRNAVEHAVILCPGGQIGIEDLPPAARGGGTADNPAQAELPPAQRLPLREAVQEYEKLVIKRTLVELQGNKSAAMARLGLSRRTFYRKLHECGLE